MKAAAKKSGDGGGEGPVVHTQEWLDAYVAQATDELLEFAKHYARTQARKVALARHVDDDLYAEDLVQDILGDTLIGVLTWEPDRVSLKKHVLDTIGSRTRHDYVHALKFERISLDRHGVESEIDHAMNDPIRDDDAAADLTRDVLAAVQDLAKDDPEVMLLVDAISNFVTKKHDVMSMTGLTRKQYAAARMRLQRLISKLPPHLRDGRRKRK